MFQKSHRKFTEKSYFLEKNQYFFNDIIHTGEAGVLKSIVFEIIIGVVST